MYGISRVGTITINHALMTMLIEPWQQETPHFPLFIWRGYRYSYTHVDAFLKPEQVPPCTRLSLGLLHSPLRPLFRLHPSMMAISCATTHSSCVLYSPSIKGTLFGSTSYGAIFGPLVSVSPSSVDILLLKESSEARRSTSSGWHAHRNDVWLYCFRDTRSGRASRIYVLK